MQNAPLVYQQRLWLGVLHAGPGVAALTHATACEQAGLEWTADPPVHVLTAKGDLVEPLEGFFFHQTRRRYSPWLHPSSTIPRIRTEHAVLLTCERDRNLRRAIGRVAATVQQRLSTPTRLLVALAEIPKLRHGRHFGLALGDIEGGAHSFAEIDVGRLCREAGLSPPARQMFRTDKEGLRRYLDCEWRLPDGSIVALEIDGSFHLKVARWVGDMRRERAVVISGRRVLRCATVEVRLTPQDVIDDLVSIGVPPLHARGFVCARPA
ncbi:MAG: hypothetical protein ACRDPB_07935 [Nocardioidaceae bacterium]